MIRVWAPDASVVEIVLGPPGAQGRPVAMTPTDGGWWEYDELVGHGPGAVDYAFRVDGSDPTPDPRSPWQPYGVHGPSRTFDATAHVWSDSQWRGPQGGRGVLGGVFYELHIGTFTPEGTFDAAIAHLDHLRDLGVDVVELMPVAAFPGRWNWGYDGVGLYAVHHPYGGPEGLQRFVDAAHARGLGVCLDVVYNHLGPSGNYLRRFGPYFSGAHHTPWGEAVNFDGPGSEGVRAFVVDNALRWLRDFHIDALRLDAVHELRDDTERHVLSELADAVDELAGALGRPLGLMAESDLNDATMVTPVDDGGLGMTGQWGDDIHHALHVVLTGETQGYYQDFAEPGALAKSLSRAFFHDGTHSTFRGRRWGAPLDTGAVDGRRIMAYLQTHDQVGNRALGDRISASITPGQQAIGAALYLTSAFTPMIFMGEEWAATSPFQFFTDHDDPELRRLVTQGRRTEFAAHGLSMDEVPDPSDPGTRDRSVLRWEELLDEGHATMLAWYRDLVALRHREPELSSGDLRQVAVTHRHDDEWLILRRSSLATVANLAERAQEIPIAVAEILLAWGGARIPVGANGIRLGGHSVAVVRLASMAGAVTAP